jgi:hypothetical protein
MMKRINSTILLLLICIGCFAFPFKKKSGNSQVYVMGVSICFSDTVVYMTGVQTVEGAKVNDKFLLDRDEYSGQLSNYLQAQDGKRTHTSVTYFDTNKNRLLKKAAKLTKKFTLQPSTELRTLSKAEFSYTAPVEEDEEF